MDNNLSRYQDPDVVSYYERQNELFDCEKFIFEKYIPSNVRILDVGVGGGRTSTYLSRRASEYVGVDYSDVMVAACKKKYPDLKFVVADASNLNMVSNGAFDAVIFSFNGIDYLNSDGLRAQCFREISRVLKSGGIFIFSSHNSRVLGVWPDFRGAYGYKYPWRIARSILKSFSVAQRSLRSSAFYSGGGYIHDPVHGGLKTYTSTLKVIKPQLGDAGFQIIEAVGHYFPVVRPNVFSPWTYYVCNKAMA